MKLTKILTLTLALALCVSALAACSPNSGTNTGSTGNSNNTTGSTEKDDPAKTLIGMRSRSWWCRSRKKEPRSGSCSS